MPQERSIKNYIANRFYNELYDGVQRFIKDNPNDLDLTLYRVRNIDDVELSDIRVIFVDVDDRPGTDISFDVAIDADIETIEEDKYCNEDEEAGQWFMVRCSGDLACSLDDFEIHSISIYSGKKPQPKPMSDALVPIISKDNLESVATDFLKRNYPKALLQPMAIDPKELAEGMGLKVELKHIAKDCSVFGQIFFHDAEAEFYDKQNDKIYTEAVKAKSIFVDPDTYFLYNLGKVNNTIIHECVHWDQHRKAFELERLYNQSASRIKCRAEGGLEGNSRTATEWMEWQANALAPRIQMPMEMFKKQVESLFSKYRRELHAYDIIDIIEPVIDEIVLKFGVSRTAAKIRLIDIGYDEAIGAFVYVDGRYVQPHKAAKGFLQRNQTFSVPAQDAAILAWTNPFLKNILDEGRYVFVDSHFVINNARYLETDETGNTVLTHYARNHMDECALVFDLSISSGIGERYHTECFLNRDQSSTVIFNVGFSNGLQNTTNSEKRKKAVAEQVASENELIASLTDDYVDSLEKAIKWRSEVEGKKITAVEISKRAGINEATVRRALNGSKDSKTETLVLICLALHLPYRASHKILDNSPSPLSVIRDQNHQWYDFALQHLYPKKVEEIKKELAYYGADPL